MSHEKSKPSSGECPVPRTLRHLHPEAIDHTKRVEQIRQELIAKRGDMTFDLTGDRSKLLDVQRAVSSLLLNYAWEYASSKPALKEKIPRDGSFWFRLSQAIEQHLDHETQLFYGGSIAHLVAAPEGAELTQLDRLMLHTRDLTKTVFGRNSFPFLSDLNLFGTQMLRALHEKYERTYSESLTQEQFMAFITQPNFVRSLHEFQFNDGDSVRLLLETLINQAPLSKEVQALFPEGKQLYEVRSREALLDRIKPFNLDDVAIDRDAHTFGIRPKLVERTVEQTSNETASKPSVRNCPVVYARSFQEMMNWLVDVVNYQVYDLPYPDPQTKQRAHRLDEGLHMLIKTEIETTVVPFATKKNRLNRNNASLK